MKGLTILAVYQNLWGWFATALPFGLTIFIAPGFAADEQQVVRTNEIKWAPCDPNTAQDPCQLNYFRGNPEKEPNHLYLRVPKGHTFPAHWHTSNEHFVLIKGVFAVGGENDKKGMSLRPGDYINVPAKWIHWGKCMEGECLAYLYVDGPDSYIDVKDRRP